MPNVEVKCSVANCYFYEEGNQCGAPAIMVEIDPHAKTQEEFSDELGVHTDHIDYAHTSKQTCCQTFRPKKRKKT